MKRLLVYLFAGIGFNCCLVACYKDKGNYTYHIPPAPVVTHLDSVYSVLLNDTLTVVPSVTIAEASPRLGYMWRVDVPAGDSSINFSGLILKMHFTLPPISYNARLTITDSTNGMEYFYNITINGTTAYSIGTFILSQESGISQLSFVAPDGTMTPRLYRSINGVDLPAGARQLIPLAREVASTRTAVILRSISSQLAKHSTVSSGFHEQFSALRGALDESVFYYAN